MAVSCVSFARPFGTELGYVSFAALSPECTDDPSDTAIDQAIWARVVALGRSSFLASRVPIFVCERSRISRALMVVFCPTASIVIRRIGWPCNFLRRRCHFVRAAHPKRRGICHIGLVY